MSKSLHFPGKDQSSKPRPQDALDRASNFLELKILGVSSVDGLPWAVPLASPESAHVPHSSGNSPGARGPDGSIHRAGRWCCSQLAPLSFGAFPRKQPRLPHVLVSGFREHAGAARPLQVQSGPPH